MSISVRCGRWAKTLCLASRMPGCGRVPIAFFSQDVSEAADDGRCGLRQIRGWHRKDLDETHMSGIEKNAYVRHRRRLAADTRELAASAMAPYKVCCKTNIDRLTKNQKKNAARAVRLARRRQHLPCDDQGRVNNYFIDRLIYHHTISIDY